MDSNIEMNNKNVVFFSPHGSIWQHSFPESILADHLKKIGYAKYEDVDSFIKEDKTTSKLMKTEFPMVKIWIKKIKNFVIDLKYKFFDEAEMEKIRAEEGEKKADREKKKLEKQKRKLELGEIDKPKKLKKEVKP
jgi:hypothetical protein